MLAPAPTVATASDYALAFDQIRAAVQAVLPNVQVGVRLDGALTPKATLAALGPLTPDLVAFHPAPAAGKGLWTTAELPQLADSARGRERNRTADPARRTTGAERRADLVARLRRAGRRRAARRS